MAYDRLPKGLDDSMWKLYYQAMEPTRADAVQRHLFTREEFDAIDWNERITKLVAMDTDNHQYLGFSAYTNRLDEYDLIETAYFQARWPDAYRRRAIFYVLFTVVDQELDKPTASAAYGEMVREVARQVRKKRGVGMVDWSDARRARRMDRATWLLIKRECPELISDGKPTDSQSFVAYEFDWGDDV
jgi:hypothetical protein